MKIAVLYYPTSEVDFLSVENLDADKVEEYLSKTYRLNDIAWMAADEISINFKSKRNENNGRI